MRPLSTSKESPACDSNRWHSPSKIPADRAFSKSSFVTPVLRPAIKPAPGAASATYQFSVLGSPQSCGAAVAGGCTCRLRRSVQSSHFTKMGKGRARGQSAPRIHSVCVSINSCRELPLCGPSATMDWVSGRSTTSQVSPILFPLDNSRPKISSRRRPPQTRSIQIGLNLIMDIRIRIPKYAMAWQRKP